MEEKTKILVVDDDREHAELVAEGISDKSYDVVIAANGVEAQNLIRKNEFDIIVTDMVLHDVSGMDLLRMAKSAQPETEVILVTGYPSSETCAQALEEGAFDYLDKPVNIQILRVKLKKIVEQQRILRRNVELQKQLNEKFGYEGIIGNSNAMKTVLQSVKAVAPTSATVLLAGESGTGKELIARLIHTNSPRRANHFIAVNCAGLSETLIESELFGHVKGAFTGATYDRRGRFEAANYGTLFLDEIGDMPLQIQPRLLRAIENQEIQRVGSDLPVKVNVRIITATNKILEELVEDGKFREDLYYRLKVFEIKIPPLRERGDDIVLLADAFVKEFAALHNKPIKGITQDAISILRQYHWPGNVRELRNFIESVVVLCHKGVIDAAEVEYLRSRLQPPNKGVGIGVSSVNLETAEAELIRKALELTGGDRARAAQMLGIGERTLYRKLKQYRITTE